MALTNKFFIWILLCFCTSSFYVLADAKVNPQMLQSLLLPYLENDPALRAYMETFDFDKYSIYPVKDQDLFYVDKDANDEASLAIKSGEYPLEPAYEALNDFLKKKSVVIVVGGHTSPRLLDLSELVQEEGRVHVFEADLKIFSELVINSTLNKCKNIRFYRNDVGADVPKNDAAANAKMLDDFQIQNVSLIRIDANGREMEVIKGALKILLRDKPALLVRMEQVDEVQGVEAQKTIQSIENLGYIHYALESPDMHLFVSTQTEDSKLYDKNVTIAILAKDKAHILPLYLKCIEMQNWPAKKTNLYIRTNNNNDATAQILREWVARVKGHYAAVYFDDTDVPEKVQQYKQHEWNSLRFKVLGKIRQDSVDWAKNHNSHYFVVDCDNFIHPDTLSAMVRANVPIVAPFLRAADTSLYANYHAAVDPQGYLADTPLYYLLLSRELKGLVALPVVHCAYFIQHNVLDKIVYDDNSYRYEYVIFSDHARKSDIPQYLDNRRLYGRLTFAENGDDISKEGWLSEFWYTK